MSLLHSFVLGMLQGITEFLPISSSAHLVLMPWFFKWQDPGLALDVFLHLGPLLALLFYFFHDWMSLLKAGIASVVERKIGYHRDRQMFWFICWGTVPAAGAGLLFNDAVENAMRAPLLIAVTLSSVGFLLYWIDGRYPTLRSFDEISFKDALFIGFAQACAIVPGVSRSGSTMVMARLLGMSREASARFSFLLSIPIILAANLFEVKKLLTLLEGSVDWTYLGVGLGSSMLFGLMAIHFLLGYVRSADFRIFAIYRMALAAVVVIWAIAFNQ